jgi:ABC-type phosphate/phosphonate transport system substrate-binding protein
MIASLPMYHRVELAAAHTRYWSAIRIGLEAAGMDCPVELTQDGEGTATWLDPSLVLSQTCGMPYRLSLHGQVTLIGTPDYGLDGCPPGYYRSAIIVRADDKRQQFGGFAEAVLAYNEPTSQSGLNAAYHHAAAHGFWFERRLRTGSHLRSAGAVADGRADIATIDAVTWRLIERYEAFASSLRVIGWTTPQPGLPYISRLGVDGDIVFGAVAEAIAGLTDSDRAALGLLGLVRIPTECYLDVPDPPPEIMAEL